MKLFKMFKKKPEVSIMIRRNPYNKTDQKWEVRFDIGNQGFRLAGVEDLESAKFYQEMLMIALKKL